MTRKRECADRAMAEGQYEDAAIGTIGNKNSRKQMTLTARRSGGSRNGKWKNFVVIP